MSARKLAERAGLSPSYLSLIEQGQKIPSEKIAIRLAEALGDEPELYRTWAEASRMPELANSLERLSRAATLRNDPEARRRIGSGESMKDVLDDYWEPDEPGEERAGESNRLRQSSVFFKKSSSPMQSALKRMLRMRNRLEPDRDEPSIEGAIGDLGMSQHSMVGLPDQLDVIESVHNVSRSLLPRTISVPLLRDGTDPDAVVDESKSPPVDTLELDRQLIPLTTRRLFAYRPAASELERVSWNLREGDLVVFAQLEDDEALDPRGVYAVRHGGRIVISRVTLYDDALLLAGDGGSPEPVRPAEGLGWRELLAGVMVTTVRRWGDRGTVGPGAQTLGGGAAAVRSLGRSVRIAGDFIERDCEWKPGYGWRPNQRPEDMDYLDAHRGMKIRYLLIRDGLTRFALEMSADEWREALGDYHDGETWRTNGYVVAVTKRRGGEYTEEFQERWARFVRAV